MKKKVVIIVILIVVALLSLMVIRNNRKIKPEVVRITAVDTGDIQNWLSTNALIESKESKEYIGTSGLTVKNVYFEVGATISKGDIILEYDLTDLKTAVEQAGIQYENAILNRTELLNQKQKLEDDMADMDANILRLNGSTNPQDIANMQALIQKRDAMQPISDEKVKLMDNSVGLAKISLNSAQERLDKVKDGIVSETDGVVTSLNAVENEPSSLSQPAAIVQNLSNLKAVISLGKYDAVKVKLGQSANIENSGHTYGGTVSFINPAASKGMAAQEAMLNADIDINDPDDLLKIDFDVSVDILIGEVKNVIKLPVECIKYDKDNNSSVFVVSDGKAVLTPVMLGMQSDTEVEVLEGVQKGDKVIMNPSTTLADGALVIEEGAAK